jgi:methionyl-tRNA formyltransferase
MRIVVLGTGPFAVPALRALEGSSHQVLCAVSRPPRGRRAKPAPVTVAAQALGIETWLPETVNDPQAQSQLTAYQADLLVVCDYGEILKPAALGTTPLGGINLHGSLLPRYRGAAPVQWAVFHGDPETGNTVIQMTPGLDAGPVLGVQPIPIDPEETAEQLEARMAELGAALTLEVVDQLAAGTTRPVAQDTSLATKAPRLSKAMGQIDWSRSAQQIKNQVRALQPWPRAFTSWQRAEPVRLQIHQVQTVAYGGEAAAGTVVASDESLVIATGQGGLRLDVIQPAGKRAMQAIDFLRGTPIPCGDRME